MYATQYARAVKRATVSLRETLAALQVQHPAVVARIELTPRALQIIAGYDSSSSRV